jgi:hypothetical protein
MILRILRKEPRDTTTVTLFLTSENQRDAAYIESLITKVQDYLEDQSGKKILRESDGKTSRKKHG